jgi:hypothetical protein
MAMPEPIMASRSRSRAAAAATERHAQPNGVVRHLSGNFPAEWEKMKARGRNLRPHDAVMECADLSALYRERHRSMAPVQPSFRQIVQTLNAKKIPFVLTGAYGISTWTGRPRSTHDVDILVKAGRNQARAVKALRELYPALEVRNLFGVTAFFVPGETESVIDVTYPHRADNQATLDTALWIQEGGLRYRIPALEAALANKYGAMLTPSRDRLKRAQDAVDFGQMVKHAMDPGREPIDLERLAALGELVWPGGGGDEILRLAKQAEAGELPTVNPPQ